MKYAREAAADIGDFAIKTQFDKGTRRGMGAYHQDGLGDLPEGF